MRIGDRIVIYFHCFYACGFCVERDKIVIGKVSLITDYEVYIKSHNCGDWGHENKNIKGRVNYRRFL